MMRPVKALPIALALVMACWATDLIAHSSGVTGKAQSATGCSCHGTSPNGSGAVTVTLTGPAVLKPSAIGHYTLSVSGGPSGTTGGLDVTCANGAFTAVTGTRVSGLDVTHTDNSHRSWAFDWTAPATEGTSNFYAIAMATDGSSNSGDSWNWNGGAVNTAFPVAVSGNVGVGDATAAFDFAPVSPNPLRDSARLAFTTTREGAVRLEVFDAQGRRAATLVAATLPAGRHFVSWDGRGEDGRRLAAGLYLARLQAEGRSLQRRVIVID